MSERDVMEESFVERESKKIFYGAKKNGLSRGVYDEEDLKQEMWLYHVEHNEGEGKVGSSHRMSAKRSAKLSIYGNSAVCGLNETAVGKGHISKYGGDKERKERANANTRQFYGLSLEDDCSALGANKDEHSMLRGAIPSGEMSHEQVVENREVNDILAECISELQPDEQICIRAVYFGGKKTSEVAVETGLNESSVTYRLKKARNSLCQKLSARGIKSDDYNWSN